MKKLFNKNFFKFTFGFAVIILLAIASIFLVTYFEIKTTQEQKEITMVQN